MKLVLGKFFVCAFALCAGVLVSTPAHAASDASGTVNGMCRTPANLLKSSTSKAETAGNYGLDVMKLLSRKFARLNGESASGKPFLIAFNDTNTSDEILYFVKPDGTLWWQTDTITTQPNADPKSNATFTEHYVHKMGAAVQVGGGWAEALGILPGGGATAYGIERNGNLNWYHHYGFLSGEATWEGPVTAGEGWNNDKVIPMGEGVLYTLSKNGTLRWNKHKTYKTGFTNYGDWVQPALDVMSGWNQYKMVFGGGNGVFYAVTKEGKLLWYRHNYLNPVAFPANAGSSMVGAAQKLAWARTWQGPKEIGSGGWDDFSKIFCAGNGHIYIVKPDGALNFFDHTGWKTGEATWGFGDNFPKHDIADGWKDYLFAFAALPG